MYPLLTNLNTKRTYKVQSKNKNHDVYSELEHLCIKPSSYLKGKLVEMNFIVVHTFITFFPSLNVPVMSFARAGWAYKWVNIAQKLVYLERWRLR